MNNLIFLFFFSLTSYPFIAWLSVVISNILIYNFLMISIIYPIVSRRYYIYSLLVATTGAIAWVLSYVIKYIFVIPRPFIINNITPLVLESGFSFPSSHVMVISALTILIWNINHKIGYVFIVFTILTAFSRMIIGVHYPVDVLGGMFFGALVGFLALWIFKKTKQFDFLRI